MNPNIGRNWYVYDDFLWSHCAEEGYPIDLHYVGEVVDDDASSWKEDIKLSSKKEPIAAVVAEESSSPTSSDTSTVSAPHILMITMDDVGMNDVGYLSTDIKGMTPTMDYLRSEGVTLRNYYGQSLCTPARATLMSGKFVHRIGFSTITDEIEITTYANYSIPIANKLLPAHMQDAGYKTYGFGKWNLGICNEAYLPTMRGFNRFAGYSSPGINYYNHVPDQSPTYFTGTDYTEEATAQDLFEANDQGGFAGIDIDMYSDEIFMNLALEQISSHESDDASTPFFLWLALQAAHDDDDFKLPTDLQSAASNQAGDTMIIGRKNFAQAMAGTDLILYKMKAKLDEIKNDYYIIVQSDNGGYPCGVYLQGSNLPYRGSKMTFFEGGVRVPAFIYGSSDSFDALRGTNYYKLMHHVDWVATLVSMAGRDPNLDDSYDSIDHWQSIQSSSTPAETLHSTKEDTARPIVYTLDSLDGGLYAAVRVGSMKFIKFLTNSSYYWDYQYTDLMGDADTCNQGRFVTLLFDIDVDPHERTNLLYDPAYGKTVMDMENLVLELYETQYYSPEMAFGSPQTTQAWEAFSNADGFVAPWACVVQ